MNAAQTVLIVDDVEMNRAILCELFKDKYEILEAGDGRQAIDIINLYGDRICVMLLDVVMPVMDGITVLSELKRLGWTDKIPVILITAENSENTFLKGYRLGVSDIVSKPFNPEIVCRRVENIIELYSHKHHLEELVHAQTATVEQQARQLKRINVLLEQQAEKLKQNSTFVIDALSTIVEFRNGESGSHIKRMRRLTEVLLRALSDRYKEYRMPADTIETISSAAALHDIGKIAIPDSVLLKPGKLTPEEFEIMKTHTVRGCELLQNLNYTQDDEYYNYCYEICRHHHERWDGRGYPDHLKGEEIPIWAQVVSIADVYEALISKRVYKSAYAHEKAVQMIADGECGVFNPSLINCFLQVADSLQEEMEECNSPVEAGA